MKNVHIAILVLGVTAAATGCGAIAQGLEPKLQVLPVAVDATQQTVLVGRNMAGEMIIQLELEPAKAMWMLMGSPTTWALHPVGEDDLFHVEVKPIDPNSMTRISYADVLFSAVNWDSGQRVEGMLHPMWGGSGLHYAMNSGLAGDGAYEATVTVKQPTFARDTNDQDLWMAPTSTKFFFRLSDGKLTEVTEPMQEAILQ